MGEIAISSTNKCDLLQMPLGNAFFFVERSGPGEGWGWILG